MSRLKPPVFRLETLEDRSVPAVFGEPWLDGRHVTISFAGDGTPISGVGSNFAAALSPIGLNSAKVELLRAFQTWVVNANLNLGLVGDSNAAFGTAGAVQGDPRYGDVRIGARSLAPDVVAITAPFSLLTPNAGDLILNSGKQFAFGTVLGKYNLFTMALQESGHAFGLGNSLDPNSVMFEQYGNTRTGLSGGDVNDIRALYGARPNDSYEGTGGNDTLATATTFSNGLQADLTNTTDADVYRYTADSSDGRWFRIEAAKLSLVAARLEVLDSAGEVLGSAEAAGPMQNDVAVYLGQLVEGETYFVRVTAARPDVFGVGAYRLVVDTTAEGPANPDSNAPLDVESDSNNTVATATEPAASAGPYDYSFRSTLSTNEDVDFFRLRAPATGTSNVTITVAGVGRTWFNPNVDLYNTSGVRVATKVVIRTDSSAVLSLDGVAAGNEYLLRVASGNGSVGNYEVVADFKSSTLPKMMGAHGGLNSGHSSTSATLNVWQSQTIQVNLLANQSNGTNTFAIVRIYDAQNREVFELYSQTGILSTGHVFLGRGVYRVDVRTLDGSPIDFSLTLFGVSDPIGAIATDTTDGEGILPPQPTDTTAAIKPPIDPTTVWF